ncbi:Glycosyl hydrolase family 26 [Verrucomicrobiia bacterium DG1235]|nr:Glycosyl hydrolase family 26 [Verrucomicrobiae bacterium DG1235]
MKRGGIYLFVAIVFGGSFSYSEGPESYIAPINPKASEEAINLYRFIQDVQGEYILSGQHNFVGKGSEYTEQLEALTGKSPVVWGADFSFTAKGDKAMEFQHAGPANLPAIDVEGVREVVEKLEELGLEWPPPPEMFPELEFLDITIEDARESTIEEAKRRHAMGHIITLMWHGCYPTDAYPCDGLSVWAEGNLPSDEEWNELVTDGTELNEAWKVGMDVIAVYLKELRDDNIPVLWRPYHEMNGEWFWWGHKKGEDGFKRLWLMTYDYLTNHHELNNLIWVWNANAPRGLPGERGIPYEDYFPGAEYVDVLACDVYRNDYKQSHHDQLVALAEGKPLALGEVGEMPSLEVLKEQPQWTWMMTWGWILFFSNEAEFIKELYDSEQVLTLDEISAGEAGRYSVLGAK